MRSSDFAPLQSGGPARGSRRFAPLALASELGGAADLPDPEEEAAGELRRAFEAGFAEGRSSRDAELVTIHATMKAALENLARFRGDLRHRYERELLELALGVAHKVVRQEVTEHPERWLEMLRTAVRSAVEREHVVVRVPPALGAYLRDVDPPLRTHLDDVKVLEIVDDAGLPDGGCVLETRFGDVDLGVDTQLESCRRALVGTDPAA